MRIGSEDIPPSRRRCDQNEAFPLQDTADFRSDIRRVIEVLDRLEADNGAERALSEWKSSRVGDNPVRQHSGARVNATNGVVPLPFDADDRVSGSTETQLDGTIPCAEVERDAGEAAEFFHDGAPATAFRVSLSGKLVRRPFGCELIAIRLLVRVIE